jgi:ComF family protein
LRAAKVLDELGALLFPPACQVCRRLAQPLICEPCAAAFEVIQPPLCLRCGRPFDPRGHAGERCGGCRKDGRPLTSARSFGLHVGTLREAVHALKFRGRVRVAPALAERLAGLVGGPVPTALPFARPPDGLVPVPLHPTRRAERGFDQAELLSRKLAELTGIPLRTGLLARTRHTQPQVGMSPAQREANVRGAFALRHPLPPGGVCVLLIDDVYTTGATLEECARVLRRGGVQEVHALTVSRAAPEWHPHADLGDPHREPV